MNTDFKRFIEENISLYTKDGDAQICKKYNDAVLALQKN